MKTDWLNVFVWLVGVPLTAVAFYGGIVLWVTR